MGETPALLIRTSRRGRVVTLVAKDWIEGKDSRSSSHYMIDVSTYFFHDR
jgi:hypothetical protein